MGEVIQLDVERHGFIEPDELLNEALGRLQETIIIGIDNDGDIYCTSSSDDIARVVMLLEIVKNDYTRGVEKDFGLVD